MQKVFNVAVDIGRKLPAPAFEVNTNDLKSVKLLITITNGQTLLNLTDTTVRIAIRKPDNHIIFQDCTVKDATNGQVEIILENQAYITPGTHTAEIMCYKGSEVVAVSGTFSYKSTKGIMNDEAVESKSEFTAITQKIEDARKLLVDIGENGVGVDEQARQGIQEVAARLADTAKKSEIQTLVTNKADLSYVDSKFGQLGSRFVFKGTTTFANIPTTGIQTGDYWYVSDRNSNYAYNGSSWVDIGNNLKLGASSITKENLAPKSVDEDKVTFVSKTIGKNLFNKRDVTPNTLFAEATPTTIALNGYYTLTNFIRIEANVTFTIRYVRQWFLVELDAVTVYQSENTNSNSAVKTITTPNRPMLLKISGSMPNLDATQIEIGNQFTTYEPYTPTLLMEGLALTKEQMVSVKNATSDIKVIKSGESFDLTSSFDGNQDILIKTIRNGSSNGSFRFIETLIGGVRIHNTADDITPIRTFYTVGANHGYGVLQVTKSGFAVADLGSKWTDGERIFTLVKVNGNTLEFLPEYTVDSNGVVSVAYATPISDLTHVSGATNTTTIAVSGHSIKQLYPSINKVSVKYVLDGKELKDDGIYYGNDLQIQEHYTVMDYKSLLDYAQANIGKSYANGNIEGVVKLSNIFSFSKGLKCTTFHGFKVLKKINVTTCGFLQSEPLLNLAGHTQKRFMPNVLPKNGIDFAAGVNLGTYSTSLVFQKADLVNADVPPSHYTDWMYDESGNKRFGFTLGYIVDKTNSKNADRIASQQSFWDMRNTKKSYPVAIDYKTFNPGDYKSFMGFRNYLSPAETGEATTLNVVKHQKDVYLYAHFNKDVAAFSKNFNEEVGKSITVLQSENLTKLNEVVDSEGVVLSVNKGQGNGVFKIE